MTGANYLLNLSKLILMFKQRGKRPRITNTTLKRKKKKKRIPGVVVHTLNPSTPQAEAGRPLSVWASLGYTSSRPARTT